ncbi:hypothetical protein FB451DRAFT_1243288 [Mycena latifolia]|nr:hypothetical protein FB451DRAFT_1243288 [Mycena latifolia]
MCRWRHVRNTYRLCGHAENLIPCESVRCKFSPNHPGDCRDCIASEQNGTLVSGRTEAQSTKGSERLRVDVHDVLRGALVNHRPIPATKPRSERRQTMNS